MSKYSFCDHKFQFPLAYKGDSSQYIADSATRYYCEYLWLKEKRESNNYSDLKRGKYINIDLCKMKEYIESKEHYCEKCGFEGDFESMLKHEKDCFGFKRTIEFQKKVYSDETATCNICDKVFYHTCKTSKPMHQLNRHKKTCEKTACKRIRCDIQKKLQSMDLNDLLDLKEYLQN